MGIIFATLVLTISSVIHNNNLSEEKIIKEAKKLGMIMPEETESNKGGLWNKHEDTESTDSDTQAATENDTAIESDSSMETEPTVENESSIVNDTEGNTIGEVTEESESTDKPVQEDEEQVAGDSETTYFILQIYPGDKARQVAERLYENGLVDSSERFRKYLGESGVAKILRTGEFKIPVGATYDEIIEVLKKR